MRAFYKTILSRTYEIFGVNQLEKMDDNQITFLLDTLENVSNLYNYISEEDQKKIINKRMITDKDYRNINARLIAGWFEQDGKVFFTQQHHKEKLTEEDHTPLEGAERDAMLTMWQNSLRQMNENFTEATKVKGGGSRLREQYAPLPMTPPEESALNEYCNEQASNKEGSEGVGEVTESSENNPDTPQSNESIE